MALSNGSPPHAWSRRDYLRGALAASSGLLAGGGAWLVPAGTANAAPAAGTSLIDLSLNENPFGPSPRALRAIETGLRGLHRYTGRDADALAQQIAAREGLPVGQVVLGNALETLALLLALEGGAGGEFPYADPGYTGFVDAAARAGGRRIPVPLDQNLENDLAAFESAVNAQTRALFLVNPHNPSGTVTIAPTLGGFLNRVPQRVPVIVDEAYVEFADPALAISAVPLLRNGANVTVFRTFDKFHGLAATPIDYVLLPAELAKRLRAAGAGSARALNRLAIVAAAASLADAGYAPRVRSSVATERSLWEALLRELGRRQSASQGNFVFFETGLPHAEFASRMLQAGIVIGRAFPPLDRWARISIGLPRENARARAAVRRILA